MRSIIPNTAAVVATPPELCRVRNFLVTTAVRILALPASEIPFRFQHKISPMKTCTGSRKCPKDPPGRLPSLASQTIRTRMRMKFSQLLPQKNSRTTDRVCNSIERCLIRGNARVSITSQGIFPLKSLEERERGYNRRHQQLHSSPLISFTSFH